MLCFLFCSHVVCNCRRRKFMRNGVPRRCSSKTVRASYRVVLHQFLLLSSFSDRCFARVLKLRLRTALFQIMRICFNFLFFWTCCVCRVLDNKEAMAQLGFFDWSGPRSVPYITGDQPGLFAGDTSVFQTDWSLAQDCKHCLRLELGCGNAPTLEENKRCMKTAERIVGGVTGGCNRLNAGVLSPFDVKAAAACQSVCSHHLQLEYGKGYARPYRSTEVQIERGEGTADPL